MPEIPDLEAIRAFFNDRIVGVEIAETKVLIPHVVRTGGADFEATLTGNRFGTTLRQGKFLLMPLADERVVVINAMLTGRFQYGAGLRKKLRARTCFTIAFADGNQLRYSDQLLMGKVYVVPADSLLSVPMFADMGPDAVIVLKYVASLKNTLRRIELLGLTPQELEGSKAQIYGSVLRAKLNIEPEFLQLLVDGAPEGSIWDIKIKEPKVPNAQAAVLPKESAAGAVN